MKRILLFALGSMFLLAGCQTQSTESLPAGEGRMGSEMMDMHSIVVPDEYANLTNPVPKGADALARGEELYALHCAVCHGDSGMGEGPAGQVLIPPAAPIAHTSLMVGDDYLFWRISEGGATFNTSMPAWQGTLSENDIWSLIIFVRALREDQTKLQNSDTQLEQINTTIADAVSQGLIKQAEADEFKTVHTILEEYLAANQGPGNAETRQAEALNVLVETEAITQVQSNIFLDVHAQLTEAGLMR